VNQFFFNVPETLIGLVAPAVDGYRYLAQAAAFAVDPRI
jgi:hypothetical protein